MGKDFDIVESCLSIPHGLLQRLSLDPSLTSVVECLERYYDDKLIYEQLLLESEANSHQNANLKCEIEQKDKELKLLQEKYIQNSDEIMKNSFQISELNNQCCVAKQQIATLNFDIKRLSSEKEGTDVENQMLQCKIHNLLNELQYKSDNLTQVYKDLEEYRSKYQDIQSQNRILKSEVDSLQIKLKIIGNSDILENRSTIENKFKEMQKQFTISIEDYNEQLCKKDSEIDALKIELRCKEKKFELIQAESTFLKEFKISVSQKCENFNNKVAFIESRYTDSISSLESRINLIEKYFKTQYEANVEIGSKMNKYLEVIQDLKEKVQTLTLEKIRLNENLQQIIDDQSAKTQEFQKNMSISQNEITLLKSMIQRVDSSYNQIDNDLTREIMGNDRLMHHFSPSAITTSKIMQKGLTLTDIYSEYVREHHELVKLQNDNQLADHQLKKLLTELDIVKKNLSDQETENLSLTKLNKSLVSSLSDSKSEVLTLNSRLRDSFKQNKLLESNVQRLSDLKVDLSGQIQILLYQVERCKDYLQNSVYNEPIDASLPFFTSITELQTVNCKLLAMIHELEAEINLQTNTIITDDSACAYHRDQLTLKEAEIKQSNEILEVTIKERDMYRMLYQYANGITVAEQDAIILKNYLPTNTVEMSEKIVAENSELKRSIEKNEADITLLKKQHNEEIVKLKGENALKDKLVKESNSKISNLESQNKNLITSIQSLETKIAAQNDLILTLENLNKETSRDVQKIKNEYEGLKSAYRALVNESDGFQVLIKNLRFENQLLYDEKLKYQPLTDQLRDMSTQLHQLDLMYKSDKNSHIDDLKKDIINLKNQLASISFELTSKKTDILNELENLKNRLFIERSKQEITLNKLELAEKTLAALQNSSGSTSVSEDQIITTQTIIENHIKEISDLKSQLENYKTICSTAEGKFLEVITEMDEFKTQFNTSQETWNRDREQYLKTIADLQKQSVELNSKIESLNQQEVSPKSESVSHDECMERLNQLIQDNNNLSEQYSNSVLAHSDSLRKINELKSQLSVYQLDNMELKEKLIKLKDETKILSRNYAEKCKEIEEINILQSQDKNANQHELDILYEQIEKLRKQLNEFQSNHCDTTMFFNESKLSSIETNSMILETTSQQAPSQTDITEYSNISANEDVWKLLEFIRTEKTLITGRLEISQTECARLSTKCAQLYDMINSLESSLQIERDMRLSEGKLDDITHYKDVLENLELFQKENIQLKSILHRNENTISELNKQLKDHEVNNRDLIEQIQSLKNNYEEKFANTEMLSKQLESAKHNINALTSQLKQYKMQEDKLQKLETTANELIKCQADIQEYKAKELSYLSLIDKLKADINQIKVSLLSKSTENEKLRMSINNLNEKLLKTANQAQLDYNLEKDAKAITTIIQEDNQTSLIIPPAKARKKVASTSIPLKISNVDKSQNIYMQKELDTSSIKAETPHTEISEKSESTQLSSINTSTIEITPNLSISSEKERSAKLDSRQPIIGPVSQTASQGSRFGLSRNVLKKDDVKGVKLNAPPFEPSAIPKFKNSIESSNIFSSPMSALFSESLNNTSSLGAEPIELSNIKTEGFESVEPGEIVSSFHIQNVPACQPISVFKTISSKPRPQNSLDSIPEAQILSQNVPEPSKVEESTIVHSEDISQIKPQDSIEPPILSLQFDIKLEDKQDLVMELSHGEPNEDKTI